MRQENRSWDELPLGYDPPSIVPWQTAGTGMPRAPDTEK
jgi:hypothetical protein